MKLPPPPFNWWIILFVYAREFKINITKLISFVVIFRSEGEGGGGRGKEAGEIAFWLKHKIRVISVYIIILCILLANTRKLHFIRQQRERWKYHFYHNSCLFVFLFCFVQTLRKYATEWIININDVTDFVREQSKNTEKKKFNLLEVARERVYPVTDPKTARLIGLGDG